MKVIFLGTGTSQGVPVIGCDCAVCQSDDQKDKRLRTSILIEVDEQNILIDTGPDFRMQMLREQVRNIHAVIYTHEHRDHVAGLDDIRPINFLNQRPISVYAEERVLEALKQMLPYAFQQDKYPGVPSINLNEIDLKEFYIGKTKIIPIRAYHYKLPVLGYRIEDFTYITDANYIPEEEKEKIVGSKYLVINALRKKKHVSHFSLSEAQYLVKEFSPRQAYFTHISHQMGFHKEVNSQLSDNMSLAFDGLHLDI
ncbi:MAG: MBL fold metallo-hydrolase [Bacteroidales bacterium]